MRSQLKSLEGKLVQFCGTLTEWREHNEKYIYACFSNLEVFEYNPDLKLREARKVYVDHLWVQLDYSIKDSYCKTMYVKKSGFGRVYWYTRSDGSLDLSIKPIESLNLVNFLDSYVEKRKENFSIKNILTMVHMLEGLFDFIDSGNVSYIYHSSPSGMSTTEILDNLRTLLKLHRRDYEANIRIQQTSVSFRKPTSLCLFRANKNIKKRVVGFA